MNQREMQVVLNLVTQNNLIVYVITIYSNDVVRMTKKPELKKQKTKTKNKNPQIKTTMFNAILHCLRKKPTTLLVLAIESDSSSGFTCKFI